MVHSCEEWQVGRTDCCSREEWEEEKGRRGERLKSPKFADAGKNGFRPFVPSTSRGKGCQIEASCEIGRLKGLVDEVCTLGSHSSRTVPSGGSSARWNRSHRLVRGRSNRRWVQSTQEMVLTTLYRLASTTPGMAASGGTC
jgi:hypothetical protein